MANPYDCGKFVKPRGVNIQLFDLSNQVRRLIVKVEKLEEEVSELKKAWPTRSPVSKLRKVR